jgi:hypothetical protein
MSPRLINPAAKKEKSKADDYLTNQISKKVISEESEFGEDQDKVVEEIFDGAYDLNQPSVILHEQ